MTRDAPWDVVLVEDNQLTRQFLEHSIESHPSLRLRAAFGTLAPASAWFEHQGADLLLVDLGLPDGSGLSLLRQVHQRWPACDMLVVSMFGDEANVVASIEAGAVGYVHKDDDAADIAATLLAVKQGASPISPMIARHLLKRLRPVDEPERAAQPVLAGATAPAEAPSAVSLSRREQEVLEFIARGYAYAEIAREQGITVHSVQTYIKKLYAKLAVHSRSEAVYQASRLGLIDVLGQRPRA